MASIGKVNEIRTETHFEWKIENFFSLSAEDGEYYNSSLFSFAGVSWFFQIYPNGKSKAGSKGFTVIRLLRLFKDRCDPLFHIQYSFGLKTSAGKVKLKRFIVPRDELLNLKLELVPNDILTVLWTMKCSKSTADARTEKLSNDLEALMKSGDHSDATIKVKGVDIALHRNILGARNPFFRAMFNSEMRENITGTISIDECEPHVFRSFVHFLYTGKVKNLSQENVCGLYEMAYKYQEELVKNECLRFMLNSMSVENFCDFVVLAARHEEKHLLARAIIFFASKTKEIICTMKWLSFMKKYPDLANNIHIKSFSAH